MRTPLWQKCFLAILLVLSACTSRQPVAAGQAAIAQTQPSSPSFEKEIAAFEASDRTNPPPQNAILFIGSSSIRMWKSLAADFPNQKVINRGFGGSQIIDSAHYADRIVIPYHPKLIVFYAGGNDINAGKSAEQVFEEFKIFVARVRAQLPATRIAYISSAPNPRRWEQIERVKKLNALTEEYCRAHRGMIFINVFPHMLGPDGQPKPDIYLDDRLHMNAKGYAIWREVVGPYLRK